MRTPRKLKGLMISSFVPLCLLSCASGPVSHYYVTPIITGQVIDKETNKPLSNVLITENSLHETKTNSNGYFKLPAFRYSYSSSDYDVVALNEASEGDFYVYKDGYAAKSYWNFGLKTSEVKHTLEVPYHIHIGKIYLEPLPEGISINEVESDYIEKLTYCQPNESQKQVNCMPIPDGVEHESF